MNNVAGGNGGGQPIAANSKQNDYERPPTANSLKTSNFDSDEIETLG
jgi:hypothetical protein